MATRSPFAITASAKARPNPDDAPVMNQTRFAEFMLYSDKVDSMPEMMMDFRCGIIPSTSEESFEINQQWTA
jgi:hypothetical protein